MNNGASYAVEEPTMGVACTDAFPYVAKVGADTLIPRQENREFVITAEYYYQYSLGPISSITFLTMPYDFTGQKFCFFFFENGILYEIFKNGKELKAGHNYTLNFDLAQAKQTALNVYSSEVSNPTQVRAVAYGVWKSEFVLMNDVDFKDEIYIPLGYGSIKGNGHTIKNVTINSTADYVGLMRSGGCF